MALALYDRVQQTGTANTTISFTLSGTVTGFQSFSVIGNANTTYYAATDSSGNWEVGLGTYLTIGPTLTRTTIYSSSNAGSAVTFSGTVNVFVTYPAGNSVVSSNNAGTSGQVLTSAGAGVAPTWSAVSVAAATPTALGTTYGYNGDNRSVSVGYQAGNSLSNTTDNAFVGKAAGYATTTGVGNVAMGYSALTSNITGSYNIAIGDQSLYFTTAQSSNIAIGYFAMQQVASSSNIGIGYATLFATSGANNIAIGPSAGQSISTGTNNLTLGYGAAYNGGTGALTTGSNNIILGYNAIPSAVSVSNENTFGNSSTTSNRFWGDFKMGGSAAGTSGQVLISGGTGVAPTWGAAPAGSAATPIALGTVYGATDLATPFKTLLGYQAGTATTGIDNTAIGQQALYTNITGTDSTAVGFNALKLATGTGNTALGSKALQAVSTGTSNVGIGASALIALTTGSNNIGLGSMAGNVTSGSGNFFAGNGSAFGSGFTAGSGSSNVVIGNGSFPWTGASGNILFGDNILYDGARYATTNYNVCIGQGTNSRYVNASYNIALGYGAMQQGTGLDGYNIGIGYFALGSCSTAGGVAGGGYNVGIGYQALNVLTSGATNTALGYNAGASLTTGSNNIIIGASANPSSATVSNEFTHGNSSITSNRFWGDFKMGGSSAGTSGQVLTSAGAGAAPTWSAVSVSAATPSALGTIYGLTDNGSLNTRTFLGNGAGGSCWVRANGEERWRGA